VWKGFVKNVCMCVECAECGLTCTSGKDIVAAYVLYEHKCVKRACLWMCAECGLSKARMLSQGVTVQLQQLTPHMKRLLSMY